MVSVLLLLQALVSILLILAILLQVKGSSVLSLFGGESQGPLFRTRRGLEKLLFQGTIALSIFFLLIALLTARLQG